MKRRRLAGPIGLILVFGFVSLIGWSGTATLAGEQILQKAEGSFEVQLEPLQTHAEATAGIGRMSIDKTFAGELEGTSQGEMLTGGSPAQGSAGYVAIEWVTGSLSGREGSFLLQHSATMTPTSQTAEIRVVPGSGRHGLVGLEGSMTIEIEDGKHFYVFEYMLPNDSQSPIDP